MDIHSEPVRGGYPPPGFRSLPGVEQVRAMAQGLIPRPPIFRLFGLEVTHAAPGTAIVRVAASQWLSSARDTQQLLPLVHASSALAARTVVPAGGGVAHRHLTLNYIRTPMLSMEMFVARAQVVMAGPNRVTTEARVEDASGRLLIYATGQFLVAVDPHPLPPAPRLEPYEEPSYPTPDPPLRPFNEPTRRFSSGDELLEHLRRNIAEDEPSPLPILRLIGGRFSDVDVGTAECEVRSSEWLCADQRTMFAIPGVIALGAIVAATGSVVSAGLQLTQNAYDATHVALKPLHPDGRLLRARAQVVSSNEYLVVADSVIYDERDQPLTFARATYSVVSGRGAEDAQASERLLATVLFADVVDSTATAERLGDTKWQELLQKNVALLRRAIAAEKGRQVKTEGDGFLATFDSPVRAVRCARAVRDSARQLGLEVRAGIHLGEIEVMGPEIAGIAVHVASRVESAAEPGTIFVTSTVREAMSGSGLNFSSRGLHQLKGVADEWHLYAVED